MTLAKRYLVVPAILLLGLLQLNCGSPDASTPTEGFVEVEGGRIWYQTMGSADAVPLLVIHGSWDRPYRLAGEKLRGSRSFGSMNTRRGHRYFAIGFTFVSRTAKSHLAIKFQEQPKEGEPKQQRVNKNRGSARDS